MNKFIIFTLFCLFALRTIADNHRFLGHDGGHGDSGSPLAKDLNKVLEAQNTAVNDIADKAGLAGNSNGAAQQILDPTLNSALGKSGDQIDNAVDGALKLQNGAVNDVADKVGLAGNSNGAVQQVLDPVLNGGK